MEIPIAASEKPDIYSYGFSRALSKIAPVTERNPTVYDIIGDQVIPTLFNSSLLTTGSAGEVVAKSIGLGGRTLQYSVLNAGYITFGDGSDADAVIVSNTTLTADKYYTNLTVNPTITLNTGGYRIFVQDTLTLNGIIARNGNAGSTGSSNNGTSGGGGGAGGAALADGYLKGSAAGAGGGNGANTPDINGTAGVAGSATSNSIGGNGSAGGAGGNATTATGGAAGAAGTATASNVKLIANWHLATLLDIGATGAPLKFDNSAGSGSGGGGASGPASGGDGGPGGGGAGSAGGIIAIYAKKIIINTSGSITALGGNGGNGGTGSGAGNKGGAGGGAGGNGGQIILVYNSLTNYGSLLVSAGSGGIGSAGVGTSTSGAAGANGNAGTVRQFAISL